MTAIELYQEAARRGLRLEPRGEKLAVIPADRLDPDFRDMLLANKPALLKWLSCIPCPGFGAIPPADLPFVNSRPSPSGFTRELFIHFVLSQTGGQPCPLAAWLVRRESAYYEGAGRRWDCSLHAYAAARDAACWQLNRNEREVLDLLSGFAECAEN